MKRLLALLVGLVAIPSGFAANPSYDSFNVNQFQYLIPRIWLKDGVTLTNVHISGAGSSVNGQPLVGGIIGGGNMTNFGPAVVGMIPMATDVNGNYWTPTNQIPLLIVGTLTLEGLTNGIATFVNNGDNTGYLTNGPAAANQVFTNVSGVITPAPGQTTNVLLFVSGLADNATNVALVVDTASDWVADDEEKIQAWRHHGTNVLYITPSGSVEAGRSVVEFWAPDRNDGIISVHDVAKGEGSRTYLAVAAIDDASIRNVVGQLIWTARGENGHSATLELSQVDTNGTSEVFWELNPSGGVRETWTAIYSGSFDTTPVDLDPSGGNGFRFGTSVVMTNGTLAVFANAGTNKVTVAYDGSITAAGTVSANAAVITNNLASINSAGAADYIDVSKNAPATITNMVAAAVSYLHATNGVAGEGTTVMVLMPNGSGSDQTLTINANWKTNVFSPVPPACTNGTITIMHLRYMAFEDTSTAASQTNCAVSFEYFK